MEIKIEELNCCPECRTPESKLPNLACARCRFCAIDAGALEIELWETGRLKSAEQAIALCSQILDPMHTGANPSETQETVDWQALIYGLGLVATMASNLMERYEKQQENAKC